MKKLLTLLSIFLCCAVMNAQDINFTFENAEITNDGTDDFYEVDVFIESTLDFRLGSGLLYFNYNTAAFGTNVSGNGNLEYSHGNIGEGYILDQDYLGLLSVYGPFIQNDNLPNRVAVSFQQAVSTNGMPNDNITATPTPLLHIKIKYVDVTQDPMICFEATPPFDDQFTTACGGGGLGVDCTNFPGVTLTSDTFDCAGATLPVTCNTTVTFTQALGWTPNTPTLSDQAVIMEDYDTAIEGNIDACVLSVEPGVTLTVRAGNYINVTSDIDVVGNLIVEHMGSVVQVDPTAQVFNGGTINVNVTTPNLASRDFMVMGSPMTGETRMGVFTDSFLVLNQNTANFVPHPDVTAQFPLAENFADDNGDYWTSYTGNINPAEGYIVRPQAGYGQPGGVFDFTYELGTLNNGDITYNVVFNNNKNDSPNALANPYASAISADDFILANAMVDEVYFWEHLTPPSTGLPGAGSMSFSMQDISMYNLMGGTAAAADPTGTITRPNGIISTAQGFAIKATAAGTAIFSNNMRRTTGNTTLRNVSSERDRVWLRVSSEEFEMSNTTLVGFTDEATASFDPGFDSRRLATVVSLFSHLEVGEDELGIQSLEMFRSEMKIPLGFSTLIETETSYTISVDQLDGAHLETASVYLFDTLTQQTTNLSVQDYIFRSNKGNFERRFTLFFQEDIALGNNEFNSTNVSVFPNPAKDTITLVTKDTQISSVTIRDVLGRLIRVISGKNKEQQSIDVRLLRSGLYVLTVQTDAGILTKKFIKH